MAQRTETATARESELQSVASMAQTTELPSALKSELRSATPMVAGWDRLMVQSSAATWVSLMAMRWASQLMR